MTGSRAFTAVFLVVIALAPAVSIGKSEAGRKVSRNGFTFVLPEGWNIPKGKQPQGRRRAKEKIFVITKDGLPLNEVMFRKRLLSAEFGTTKRRLAPGMMPQEMAEVVLNDFELNQGMKNFEIIENKPATIAGVPGFRVIFSYRGNGTLRYGNVLYGFRMDDMFYSIWYSAPNRHYFDTNLATFEQIVKTLTLNQNMGSPLSPGDEN